MVVLWFVFASRTKKKKKRQVVTGRDSVSRIATGVWVGRLAGSDVFTGMFRNIVSHSLSLSEYFLGLHCVVFPAFRKL